MNTKIEDFENETKKPQSVQSEAGTIVFRSIKDAIEADKYKRKLKKGALARVGIVQIVTKEE